MAYDNQWNWQQKDWPNFIYDTEKFTQLENQFLQQAGVSFGAFKHINENERQDIMINFMSDEAMNTSEIEGEALDRASLQSSIKRQLGLQAPQTPNHPAENGISEMMIDLYHHYDAPLRHEILFQWHEMLMNGRRDIADIGAYRTHNDPMQVVSSDHRRKVYFEAPPSKAIPKEMDQFIAWFNDTETGQGALPPLIRASIAHLYFESIHPFEDGNGRIGRALVEKILSQYLNRPAIIALSETINQEKGEYYKELATYSHNLDINGWIEYFAKVILKAQEYSVAQIEFIIAKGQFMQRYEAEMNPRQEKAILRMFEAGVGGFKGGLSAKNYMTITDAPSTTATRDLNDLVNKGILTKTGSLKSTRYWLNITKS